MNRSATCRVAYRPRWIRSLIFVLLLWTIPIGAAEPPLDIRVVSEKEVVFDWKRDRCDDSDYPDEALTAFRRSDGQIVGLATHWLNRLFLISRDGAFKRDCRIVYKGAGNPNPAAYDDKTWVMVPWTVDGRSVFALANNEYQGHNHPGKCAFKTYFECWYNSIVLLHSDDGGNSFQRIAGTLPVAAAAFPYEALQGSQRGFFAPTSVVRDGGHLYTIVFTTGGNGQKPGHCLFRTRDFGNDSSWEYWTGKSFYPSRVSAYQSGMQQRPGCQPLQGLNGPVWSLRRHRSSGLFLATIAVPLPGADTGMIGISVSHDLYSWSPPVAVLSVPLWWSKSCSDKHRYAYASLIDLNSPDRNFTEIGNHAAIYMTEMRVTNCHGTADRNLVRYWVEIASGTSKRE